MYMIIYIKKEKCPSDHILDFGPSGVRALPLAAGINEGGHYFGPSMLRAQAEQLRWPLF